MCRADEVVFEHYCDHAWWWGVKVWPSALPPIFLWRFWSTCPLKLCLQDSPLSQAWGFNCQTENAVKSSLKSAWNSETHWCFWVCGAVWGKCPRVQIHSGQPTPYVRRARNSTPPFLSFFRPVSNGSCQEPNVHLFFLPSCLSLFPKGNLTNCHLIFLTTNRKVIHKTLLSCAECCSSVWLQGVLMWLSKCCLTGQWRVEWLLLQYSRVLVN